MNAKAMRALALGVLGESAPESPELWHALLSGEWSLIDHFDSGGRRYVIAVRRRTGSPLTTAERELLSRRARGLPLKVLAGELGVSVPTVSRRLERAREKLGLRGQADLAKILARP